MMDGEGEVIATHQGARTVEGFQETAQDAIEFLELEARAEAGDRDAEIEYTLRLAGMGRYELDELEAAIAGLGDLTPEQRKEFNGALANLMVAEVQNTAEAERFLEMEKKGLIPTSNRAATHFYDTLVRYAAFKKDVEVFERALPELERLLAANPRAQNYLDHRRKQLASLKAEMG